jgi:hypothetical protein
MRSSEDKGKGSPGGSRAAERTRREFVTERIWRRMPCGLCRCLVSDCIPRVTLVVLLGRTVLLIVAQWFVLGAREREREKRFSTGSGRFERRNTLLPRMSLFMWCVTCGVS